MRPPRLPYDDGSVLSHVVVLDTWNGIGLVGHAGSVLKLLVGGIPTGVVFASPEQVVAVAVALADLADEIRRPDPKRSGFTADAEELTPRTVTASPTSLATIRANLARGKDEKS